MREKVWMGHSSVNLGLRQALSLSGLNLNAQYKGGFNCMNSGDALVD